MKTKIAIIFACMFILTANSFALEYVGEAEPEKIHPYLHGLELTNKEGEPYLAFAYFRLPEDLTKDYCREKGILYTAVIKELIPFNNLVTHIDKSKSVLLVVRPVLDIEVSVAADDMGYADYLYQNINKDRLYVIGEQKLYGEFRVLTASENVQKLFERINTYSQIKHGRPLYDEKVHKKYYSIKGEYSTTLNREVYCIDSTILPERTYTPSLDSLIYGK